MDFQEHFQEQLRVLVDKFASDMIELGKRQAIEKVGEKVGRSSQFSLDSKTRRALVGLQNMRATLKPLPSSRGVNPEKVKLIDKVLKYTIAHDADKAAKKFGVSKGTIAAWKAHRTMGTYK